MAIADLLHYQPVGLTRYVISNPDYQNPLAGATLAPSVVRLAPDVQIPQTLQYTLGLDHQLQKTTTLSLTYTGARGYHLFRSRDINAPPPPYIARPDPNFGVVREIESDGRQESDSLQITLRGKMTRWFNGQAQYTLSRVYNDTNGIASFPANDYDLSGEWARADFDRRHRFLVLGRVSPGAIVDLGIGLSLNSGGPYSETRGGDVYDNGTVHARPPGVPRNSLETSACAGLDFLASRRRDGRRRQARRTRDDVRARRVQRAQPRQLCDLRRDAGLNTLRSTCLGAGATTTAVLRANQILIDCGKR